MATSFAHLPEMPRKMGLSREDNHTLRQIWRDWALLGIAVIGALAATRILESWSCGFRSQPRYNPSAPGPVGSPILTSS
jgi:hypothetical protein